MIFQLLLDDRQGKAAFSIVMELMQIQTTKEHLTQLGHRRSCETLTLQARDGQ